MSRKNFDTTRGKNRCIHKTAREISHSITAKYKPCAHAIRMYHHKPYSNDMGQKEVAVSE